MIYYLLARSQRILDLTGSSNEYEDVLYSNTVRRFAKEIIEHKGVQCLLLITLRRRTVRRIVRK